MKKLTIDWIDLELAFEVGTSDLSFEEVSSFLDTETGQVVRVDESVRQAVEEIMEELEPLVADGKEWTEEDIYNSISYENQIDWMRPAILAAIQIHYRDAVDRFQEIPDIDSSSRFRWMEDFVETIQDKQLQARLGDALRQRKPFRNFREAIRNDRGLDRQWSSFERARQREKIVEWLESIDVEPLNSGNSTDLPPLPDLRKIMFDEVRRFVGIVRKLSGFQRIALIGSLASDKEFPKDIDLLVTITDDCDLSALAKLGRQIAGQMAIQGAGADVFLASCQGEYLGRICSWKKCGRGIRASCDALSCGVRRYLHDDFGTIRLSKELIQSPPVQLWPEATAVPECPSDLIEQLIQPLLAES